MFIMYKFDQNPFIGVIDIHGKPNKFTENRSRIRTQGLVLFKREPFMQSDMTVLDSFIFACLPLFIFFFFFSKSLTIAGFLASQ